MELGELRCREGREARPFLGEARAILLSALQKRGRGARISRRHSQRSSMIALMFPQMRAGQVPGPSPLGIGAMSSTGRARKRAHPNSRAPAPSACRRCVEDGLEHDTRRRGDSRESWRRAPAREVEGITALAGRKQRARLRQAKPGSVGDRAGDALTPLMARANGPFLNPLPPTSRHRREQRGGLPVGQKWPGTEIDRTAAAHVELHARIQLPNRSLLIRSAPVEGHQDGAVCRGSLPINTN